jgi:hypothetical protein
MFDIAFGNWIVVALMGLILFKPDDWQSLAFEAGKIYRRVYAYIREWQEYLDYDADRVPALSSDSQIREGQGDSQSLFPLRLISGRLISSRPPE